MNPRPLVVGLGELLWDLLPTGAHLGGAPANFAYVASLLGAESAVASRVGDDQLGQDARSILRNHGLDVSYIQFDDEHPTGTVNVHLGAGGTPSYEIVQNVAWDWLDWTPELEYLAQHADAVCFGSLVQRSAASRETVQRFLDHTRPECLIVFDVNLRPPFSHDSVIRQSLCRAHVLKLNHEEVSEILRVCSVSDCGPEKAAQELQRQFGLRAVCITRGANGSVIATGEGSSVHPGIPVAVADTIGAGDAFTAGLTLQLLRGAPLQEVSRAANSIGAWVASRKGAMPVPDDGEREKLREWVKAEGRR